MDNKLEIYRDPIFIDWYVDSDGKKVSVLRENEQHKVVNGHIVISEVMDKFYRVTIENMIEIEWNEEITLENQYACNYNLGLIKLHPNKEGQTINVNQYYSRGVAFYPSSRIYTKMENNQVTETLADIISTGESAITNIQTLEQKIQEVTTATTNANNQTASMQTLESTVEINETTRTNSELTREQNEQTRISNENTRINSENLRIQAETDRETAIDNLAHKDEYNPVTTYQPRNIVSYQGSGYMCILESTGNLPTNTTYWKKLVSKGDKGATLTPRGVYEPATTYQYGDLVTYDGSTYYAIQTTTGNLPTNITYWEVFMSGGGDMQKDTYDTNNNGQVDKADDSDKLGGQLPSYYATATELHSHTNKDSLDRLGVDASDNLTIDGNLYESGAKINDATTSTTETWSSNKTNNELNNIDSEINTRQLENIGYGIQTGLDVLASATPDMNVHVQTSVIYMPDGQRFSFDTITTKTVTTADITNPRKDIIYVSSTRTIEYLAGTPAATPIEPTLPNGAMKLCIIDVPANDTTIEQAQLYDDRILKGNLPDLQQQLTTHTAEYENKFYDNAGAHNGIYRGKYLGSAVTPEQYQAISSGTFEDLYIGDYWTIGGINYRIAGFNYFKNVGDTALTANHVTIVPDTVLYNHVMNDTNITTGGYVGSKMYTAGLAQAITTIESAFPGHIVSHRQLLTNAVTDGKASGWAWYDSKAELMNEVMVYGSVAWGEATYNSGYNVASGHGRLPLFALRQDMVNTRQTYWLRDVVSAAYFALANSNGSASGGSASNALGVRPAFSIS